MNIFAQGVGFCGSALMFLSYQQKLKQRIILFQIFSIALFTVHFSLLGAWTGAAMNFLGLIRAVVYYNKGTGKAWASSRLWFWGLMAAYLAAGILSWNDWFSLLPLAAMILSTYAYTIDVPKVFRRLMFPCSPLWLVYNIRNVSYSGIITECIVMTSLLIAMVRFDWLHHSETRE